jgi:hypothetical protein
MDTQELGKETQEAATKEKNAPCAVVTTSIKKKSKSKKKMLRNSNGFA